MLWIDFQRRALKNTTQIIFRVQIVDFCSFNQCQNPAAAFGTFPASVEQRIFPKQRKRSYSALRCILFSITARSPHVPLRRLQGAFNFTPLFSANALCVCSELLYCSTRFLLLWFLSFLPPRVEVYDKILSFANRFGLTVTNLLAAGSRKIHKYMI